MFRQGHSILFLIDLKIGPTLNLTSHWCSFNPVWLMKIYYVFKIKARSPFSILFSSQASLDILL